MLMTNYYCEEKKKERKGGGEKRKKGGEELRYTILIRITFNIENPRGKESHCKLPCLNKKNNNIAYY